MNIRKISINLHLLLLLVFLAVCATVLFNAPIAISIGLFGALLGLAVASFIFSLHIGRTDMSLQGWINTH